MTVLIERHTGALGRGRNEVKLEGQANLWMRGLEGAWEFAEKKRGLVGAVK